jgi:heme-degrading monooxygenase HmoA
MYIVISRSTRTPDYSDLYSEWSEKMEHLVASQSGYQSHFSFRDGETGDGVTVSYFDSEKSISQWRDLNEHLEAQTLGREHFYEGYTVEVAHIERRYEWHK